MADYKDTDLAFSNDGDLVLDESGDLALSTEFECTKDDINMALKTQKGDYQFDPGFGTDLEMLVGLPNIREVGEMGTMQIVNSLVRNNIVNPSDLVVAPVPIDDTILYYIVVERNEQREIVEYSLNLSGVPGR